MRVEATFTTKDFVPTETEPIPAIRTGFPVGVATMEKLYSGDMTGHSATLFTAAFDATAGVGAYIAMESFEGTVLGRAGAFNFMHAAATSGSDRTDEFFSIVAGSGTGELKNLRGTGGMAIDSDGTHRIWLEVEGLE